MEQRRTQQAVDAIAELIQSSYNKRKLSPRWAFREVEVPLRSAMPSDIGSRWEKKFIKNRWYEGWDHSIQPLASFHADSTERTLAFLFDGSKSIQWWLRLYEPGEVWIERDNGKKYYPDFIVLDTAVVFWVIEGKSDLGARDIEVIDKKNAAEEWARQVRDDQRFGIWRYIFATEAHIKQSKSWEELLVRTKPER